VRDRGETRDLAGTPAHRKRLLRWRNRLIEILAARPDGFTDGKKLLKRPQGWAPVASA